MAFNLPCQDWVCLTVSVRSGARVLVPPTFTRLTIDEVKSNTCLQLLERILREHDHVALADQLQMPECDIVMKCTRAVGVLNTLGTKRSRAVEEVVATTFLPDLLSDAFKHISDELLYIVTPPPPPQPRRVDATVLLMRAASSKTLHRPDKKSFKRMTGEHNLYNAILEYLEQEGVGWSHDQLESGKEFLDHVSKAFWVLTPKVQWYTRPPLLLRLLLAPATFGRYFFTPRL